MESTLARRDHPPFQASYSDFINALNIPENTSILAKDLSYIVKYDHNIDTSQFPSFARVYTDDQFMRFLCSPGLDVVLLENTIPILQQRISVQSVSVATLVVKLTEALPNSLNLPFFCASHSSKSNAVPGPRGMLRCFLYEMANQLNSEGRSNFSFINHEDRLRVLSGVNIDFLCEAFWHLVAQLGQTGRPRSVNCFMDNIPLLIHDLEWRKDLITFFTSFYSHKNGQQGNVKLKLILTSHNNNTKDVKSFLNIQPSEVIRIMPTPYAPALSAQQMAQTIPAAYGGLLSQ